MSDSDKPSNLRLALVGAAAVGIVGAGMWALSRADEKTSVNAMKFEDVKAMLLDGLRTHGWTVVENLKVPHATKGNTRLWFKPQAIWMNDLDTDYRNISNAHSLSMDMREYKSVEALLSDVERCIAIHKDYEGYYGR